MKFYIINEDERKIAVIEYTEGTESCGECNSIVIQPGSFMSRHTVCVNKWYDCKRIDDARDKAISMEIGEDFDNDYYVFIKKLSCESPIKATSVILGHIETDAWDLIVNEEGKTLKELFR